jgi:hypothetical protein
VEAVGRPAEEVLHLPLSDFRLTWRSGGKWRIVAPQQWDDEQSGEFSPVADEWTTWSGQTWSGMRGEYPEGEVDSLTWWLLYGEVPGPATKIIVSLPEGIDPPIYRVDKVWACEWRSVSRAARIRVGNVESIVGSGVRGEVMGPQLGWVSFARPTPPVD